MHFLKCFTIFSQVIIFMLMISFNLYKIQFYELFWKIGVILHLGSDSELKDPLLCETSHVCSLPTTKYSWNTGVLEQGKLLFCSSKSLET